MNFLPSLVGAFLGVAFSVAVIAGIGAYVRRRSPPTGDKVIDLIRSHISPIPLGQITIVARRFPYRVRSDLQQAIDQIFGGGTKVLHLCGVRQDHSSYGAVTLSDCMTESPYHETLSAPLQFEDVDIGEQQPIRCLKNGLWLLEEGSERYVVLLSPAERYGESTGIQVQIGTIEKPEGIPISQRFFRKLEEAILEARSYRGKILSLEESDSYTGEASGIKVHKLRTVDRDQVILPAKTLDLLDRNVIQFVRQRPELARFRMPTKKGILFYGPPGTGKTHTIHYLAKALAGHTTLLITAEQVGLLGEYMTLARLLQPSIVVIEDVDLIARERSQMGSPCEEVLLNKLLNEMDGLKEEADMNGTVGP